MRIKVLKRKKELNERILSSTSISSKYILNDLLNPDAPNSIFNKKLIFYDLETMGLLPSPYVHQIAALEYDLTTTMAKIVKGKTLTPNQMTAPSPTSGCVVKNKFELEQFKEADDKVRKSRQKFYRNFLYNTNKDGVIKKVSDAVKLSLANKGNEKFVNLSMSKSDVGVAIMGNNLYTQDKKEEFYSLLQNHLESLEKEGLQLTPVLEKQKEELSKEKFDLLLQSNTRVQTVKDFMVNLFSFINNVLNSPYSFYSPGAAQMKKLKNEDPDRFEVLKGHYNNQLKLKKLTLNYLKKQFNLTWAENRAFTKYADFPLPEYFNFVRTSEDPSAPKTSFRKKVGGRIKTEKKGLPTEKEGLEIFLNYLKDIGNNEYILIGHNIKTFDNNVILMRSKENEIDDSLILDFQDSFVFDTLDIMRIYVKQITFMHNVCQAGLDKKMRGRKTAPAKAQKTADSILAAKQKHDSLKDVYSSLKAKLDGLMKLHDSTKDIIQTHTADDDCKQLANVFIPTVLEMTKMIKDYEEILNLLSDSDEIDIDQIGAETFTQQKRTPSDASSSAISKIKSDLLFDPDIVFSNLLPGFKIDMSDLEFTPKDFSGSKEEYAELKQTATELQKSVNVVIREFFYFLLKELYPNASSIEDADYVKIMTMRRSDVVTIFKKWCAEEASANPAVNKAIAFMAKFRDAKPGSEFRKTKFSEFDLDSNPMQTKPQEDDPLNLSESIFRKWKKIIK